MGTGIPEWLDDGASAECGLTGFERASGRLRKIPRLFSPLRLPSRFSPFAGRILIRRKSQILIDNRTMDTVDEAIRLHAAARSDQGTCPSISNPLWILVTLSSVSGNTEHPKFPASHGGRRAQRTVFVKFA